MSEALQASLISGGLTLLAALGVLALEQRHRARTQFDERRRELYGRLLGSVIDLVIAQQQISLYAGLASNDTDPLKSEWLSSGEKAILAFQDYMIDYHRVFEEVELIASSTVQPTLNHLHASVSAVFFRHASLSSVLPEDLVDRIEGARKAFVEAARSELGTV